MSTNDNTLEIAPGSKVTLHMAMALADGTEAMSTFGEEPVTLTLGDGKLQPGMEMALYGLKVGDTEAVTLTPEQGYGLSDPELLHQIPRDDFPDDIVPEPGKIIAFSTPNGDELPGMVTEIGDDLVKVDFNHPLAGRDVLFRVEILAVEQGIAPES